MSNRSSTELLDRVAVPLWLERAGTVVFVNEGLRDLLGADPTDQPSHELFRPDGESQPQPDPPREGQPQRGRLRFGGFDATVSVHWTDISSDERLAQLLEQGPGLDNAARVLLLDQIAAGLAHRIRNPLGSITNAAYLLDRTLATHTDPDVARAVSIIREEAWRANRIVSEVLDYARPRPPVVRPTQLSEVLKTAEERCAPPNSIRLEHRLEPLPSVMVDAEQLASAVEQLVRNAIEVLPAGGVLCMTLKREGDDAIVAIEDSGPGVEPTIEDRIFLPLVTSKPLGLGLGLPSARSQVELMGGQLRYERRAGRTHFVITLPSMFAERDDD